METSSSYLPDFVREQTESAADPTFSAQLVEIAQRFASQKKRVIFISRAWPYDDDRLRVREEWSVACADMLYDHLQLLGFEVILDKRDLGVGNQLDDAMKTSVDKADHVLMLVTRTYIHKATKVPTSGVYREVHYITHKVESMDPEGIDGWVIAGKRRFVLPFAFNDTKGFPLADSHPGIATIFVQNAGYRSALIDLAMKVYNVDSALLREIVPSRANVLIQAVKKCYQERNYIPRPFHDEPLPIEKGYVRLAIVKEAEQREKTREALGDNDHNKENASTFKDKRITSFEQIYGAKEPVDIADIFKPDREGKDKEKAPKRLLVLGRAGIGKSTLCQKVAYQWASSEVKEKLWEEEDGQEKFKLVVWVPLRNLLDYPEYETLSDVILKECISKDQSGEKSISKEAVVRGLKELKPNDILFVCDGYDEVAGRTTPLIDEILTKENVFVTTRPHGINQYLTSGYAKPFDRKFENIGFLDEDIGNYIRAFFGSEEENQKYAEMLIQFLEAHLNIWGIAHIPINLMLICVTWKENYERFNPKEIKNVTITDLYLGLVVNLGRRYLDKNKIKGLQDFEPEDILEHQKCKSVLAVLSELAFDQMDNESLLIPGKALTKAKLRKSYPDLPSLRDDAIHFGVLSPTTPETNSEKTEFYFVHLTFQEFLAAFYIAEKLRKKCEEIKQYILRNKYSLRHEMVWWFVAGLLKDEANVLEMFFDILEAQPRDLAEIHHQMLLMRCMDECELKIMPQREEQYLSNLCQLIEAGVIDDWLFYQTIVTYLNLSGIISRHPEIENRFCELLLVRMDEKKSRQYFLSLLSRVEHLPKELIDFLLEWFIESGENSEGRLDVIKFFCKRKNLSLEVQKKMAAFFSAPTKETKAHELIAELTRTHNYLNKLSKSFSSVWVEIQRGIASWLTESASVTERAVAVYFFRRCESITEDVQRSIAAFLCSAIKAGDDDSDDDNLFMKYKLLKYFDPSKQFSKEILEEVQSYFVKLLVDPEQRKVAAEFFEKCRNISEDAFISIAALLTSVDSKVRKAARNVFICHKYDDFPERLQRSIAALLAHPEASVRKIVIEIFTDNKNSVEFGRNEKIILAEIQRSIHALLDDPDWEVKLAVARFFCKDRQLSEEIQRAVVSLLVDSLSEARKAVLTFLGYLKEVSDDTQRVIAASLADPQMRVAAVEFFCGLKNEVSSDVQIELAAFLSYSHWDIPLKKILEFFGKCNDVSEEIQSRIAGLFTNSDVEIRIAAINFFNSRKKISEEMLRRIVALLDSSCWRTTVAVVNFFRDRSETVSEEVEKKIQDLLINPKLELRTAAISFFKRREEVSEGTLRKIFVMFIMYPRYDTLEDDLDVDLWYDSDFRNRHNRVGCDGCLEFFASLKKIPEEIERSFAGLLTDLQARVREDAVAFFSIRQEISVEIQETAAALLTESAPGLRETGIKFFAGRKEVSEEIQEIIAALLTDPEQQIRERAIKFLSSREEVRNETQVTIATLTENSGKDAEMAIEFLEKRVQTTPSVLIAGVESLMRSQAKLSPDRMIKILNNIAVSLIIECFDLMEKANISKEFLMFFVVKLVLLNVSIYPCSKTCIQVGNENVIHFKNQEELMAFVKNFKKVFAEFTGLNFDKTEESVEIVSEARVVSRVGLLPAPGQNSNNNPLPESRESSKKCVIC